MALPGRQVVCWMTDGRTDGPTYLSLWSGSERHAFPDYGCRPTWVAGRKTRGGDTKYRDSMRTGPTGSRDFANLASAQVHEVKPTKRHLPSHADRKYTYCDLCACTRQKWPKLSFKFAKKSSRFTGNRSRRDG